MRAELLRAHYAQMPAVITAPTIGAVFTAFVLWDSADRRVLAAGVAAVTLMSALRLLLYRQYRREGARAAERRRWRWLAIGTAAVSGCIWGCAAPLLYPPASEQHAVFIVVLLTLLPIVPIAALACYMPVLYAYCIPCALPFVAMLALRPGQRDLFAAVLLLMMLAAMLTFARRYSRSLAQAVQLRQALAQQADELAQAVRYKTTLLRDAGHDLLQPLRAMVLTLEGLRQTRLAARHGTQMGLLDESLRSLQALLHSMLDEPDAMQPRAGRHAPLAVHDLLARLHREHAALAAQQGLRLRLSTRPLVVLSDAALLERVVRNLLSNALAHAGRGHVLLGCRSRGQAGWLLVADSGVGLAHARPASAAGHGRGLDIVERSLQALGHRLVVRTRAGLGTRYSIELPLAPGTRPNWVLMLDADPAAAGAVAAALGDGTRVCRCAADAAALQALPADAGAPLLALLDGDLSPAPGAAQAASAALRLRYGAALPVIWLTRQPTADAVRAALGAGCRLLHKPLDPEVLRLSIDEACAGRGAAA